MNYAGIQQGPLNESGAEQARDLSILMAYDAFRICLGFRPRHYTLEQVLLWMKLITR